MPEYPLHLEKVHAPALRDDTLARDRLIDWLEAKSKSRVTLIVAEAGYGKTTLLADWARRTSVRVLWYRLDRGDRDWVAFMAYLVAAVRAHVPGFGPATAGLLRETGSSAPPLDAVLNGFIRDLADLPPDPTMLILDDFHLVDDSDEVRHLAQEVVERAPSRLHIAIAARRGPRLQLARLRSMAELAELDRGDLRFDAQEVGGLLQREAFGLDVGMVEKLQVRTEGWPASLQLIRTALRDRDVAGVRALVDGLSSAESPVHEYLAEEVMAGLQEDLQQFLLRTSLLETVNPELAAVVTGLGTDESARLIEVARTSGLLANVSSAAGSLDVRAHPLVRAFLRERLEDQVTRAEVLSLHLSAAVALETGQWRLACLHYLAAEDRLSVIRVVETHIPEILGTGAYLAAADLLAKARAPRDEFPALLLGARVALQKGHASQAVRLANRAHDLRPTSPEVAATLMATRTFAGDVPGAIEAGQELENRTGLLTSELARASRVVLSTSVSGRLDDAMSVLETLSDNPDHDANARYRGITLANQAYVLKGLAAADRALEFSNAAVDALLGTGAVIEEVSARLARAWALAHLGHLNSSRLEAAEALSRAPDGQRLEVLSEVAEIEFYYGDFERALAALELTEGTQGEGRDQATLIRSQLLASRGRPIEGRAELNTIQPLRLRTSVAFEARRQVASGYVALMQGQLAEAASEAGAAVDHARAQGAQLWELYGRLVRAVATGADPSSALRAVGFVDPSILSMAADLIGPHLEDVDDDVLALIELASEKHPDRWRPVLRAQAVDASRGTVARRLLTQLGDASDVVLLHDLGRSARSADASGMAKALARRLATRVRVMDLGRLRVEAGRRVVEGSTIRRKVLSLLCYLCTKPGLSASREDVCEALWPDLDPGDALNSLNQTAYFLRRLFEPAFKEALSPGYLHQDGETIWLDPDLVETASASCRALIIATPAHPSLQDASRLLDNYPAPFALDFAYEDWAEKYREPLHASVLRIAEQAIRDRANENDRALAITVAERVLVLEPEAESIQAALIGLYRAIGAHTAAAEQYELYVGALRGLGLDAPPIAEVQ